MCFFFLTILSSIVVSCLHLYLRVFLPEAMMTPGAIKKAFKDEAVAAGLACSHWAALQSYAYSRLHADFERCKTVSVGSRVSDLLQRSLSSSERASKGEFICAVFSRMRNLPPQRHKSQEATPSKKPS